MLTQTDARLHSVAASLAVLLLAAATSAQAQFMETGKLQWLTYNEPARRVVAGDLDGDGDIDLVTGSQPVRTYRNLGGGSFVPAGVLVSLYEAELALLDADGDRDLDLVVISNRIAAQLWLNDGAGNFQEAVGRLPAAPAYSIAAGDVDRDGDQDLVAGSWFGPAMLWLNDGSGRFADVTGTHMPLLDRRTPAVAFADIDRDGDLDVFLGNVGYYSWPFLPNPGYSVLCVNDGSGRFSDATAQLYAYGAENAASVAFADVDLDGDPDLIVADSSGLRLHRNDGTGRLVAFERITTGFSTVARFAIGDIDGDADPDIVPALGLLLPYVNDGSGRFTLGSRLSEQQMYAKDVAAVDVDGDRDVDLLAAGEIRSRLLLNDGQGRFADATVRAMPIIDIAHGVLGDLDGDGDGDAATTGSPPSSGVWRNDGRGWFTQTTSNIPYQGAYPIVALDVDGDRDLDLLLISGTSPQLYLNDGSAGFTHGTAGRLPSLRVNYVVAGDVDGDGDIDAVTSQLDYGPLTLLSNDGRGVFTARTLAAVPSRAMLLVDVDRDGDLDLLAGEYGRRLRQFRNDGRGSFTEAVASTMPATTVWATEIAAGDIDGDGDQDLVIASGLLLYLNDGLGGFTDGTVSRIPGGLRSPVEIALGDVDDDGDLDLAGAQVYETHTGNYQGILLINDGGGVFSEARQRVAGKFSSFGARLADVDGDGDLDLYDAMILHTNLHRHCHAPWLARIGYPYRLDLYSQPGYGSGVHFAIPAIADAPGSLLLPPFGRLGLDPARMVKLPVVAIGGSGLGSLTLDVPNDQAIVGMSFYFQALMVTSPDLTRARFTNVVRDVISAQ